MLDDLRESSSENNDTLPDKSNSEVITSDETQELDIQLSEQENDSTDTSGKKCLSDNSFVYKKDVEPCIVILINLFQDDNLKKLKQAIDFKQIFLW